MDEHQGTDAYGSDEDMVTAGPPEQARPRWLGGRRGAFVLVAVVMGAAALGVTGLASAVSPSPSPSPGASANDTEDDTAPAPRPFRDGPGPRFKLHHGPGLGGPPGTLHGEFVVRRGEGEFQTLATQRGEVTKVSTSSITVKSADGYSRTYGVTETTVVNAARDGIDTVEVGDTVHVLALVENGHATAMSIGDGTRVKAGLERIRPERPTPSASTSGAGLDS